LDLARMMARPQVTVMGIPATGLIAVTDYNTPRQRTLGIITAHQHGARTVYRSSGTPKSSVTSRPPLRRSSNNERATRAAAGAPARNAESSPPGAGASGER
jgi:hypothetical protein